VMVHQRSERPLPEVIGVRKSTWPDPLHPFTLIRYTICMPMYCFNTPYSCRKISGKPTGNFHTTAGSLWDHFTLCTHVTPFIPNQKLLQKHAIFMTINSGKIGQDGMQGGHTIQK